MAYCGITDVRAVLQARREPYDDDVYSDEAVELAINHAESLINAYCGRHFLAEDITENRVPEYSPSIGRYIITGHPVVSVISVVNVYGVDVDYEQLTDRVVIVDTSEPVQINYYYNDPTDPVPDEIAAITAQVAANILANPPTWLANVSVPITMATRGNAETYLPAEIKRVLSNYMHLP